MENEKRRILVAIDFSESSRLALVEARELASRLDARLDLAHVATPPPPSPADLIGVALMDLAHATHAKELLTAMARALEKEGLHAEPHLRVGTVVMGLLDLIGELQPSLVVVGSHGKSAITRVLLGSVAESLIRRSPVPVLVVPSPRRHAAAARAAWSCSVCGHILGAVDSASRCDHCGTHTPQWISAPLASEPIDAGVPATSDGERETIASSQANDPIGLFATSPGGTQGGDINPELRVRY